MKLDTGEEGQRVSTLELFFDLVFVFTITQVAYIVEHHPTWEHVGQAMVELLVIYWMYGGYAWLTNTIGSDTGRKRVLLLIGMASFFIVSLTVPRAFGDDGVAFGLDYLALNVIHLVGFMSSGTLPTIRSMIRIGSSNLVAAGLVLAAGFAPGDARWPLWLAALLLQWLTPLALGLNAGFAIDAEHFAERHGLMIIIVLGESLVSVALAAQSLPVDLALAVGTLCGLAAAAAMWWCYFSGDDDQAAAAFRGHPVNRRGTLALFGYDLPHVLMMAGIVSLSAGTRLSLPKLTEATSTPAAALIAAGSSVYLAGSAMFRTVLRFADPGPRALGGLLALALIPIGTRLGAAQELLAVAALLVVVLLAERLRHPAPCTA